jgi:hypothetical protein
MRHLGNTVRCLSTDSSAWAVIKEKEKPRIWPETGQNTYEVKLIISSDIACLYLRLMSRKHEVVEIDSTDHAMRKIEHVLGR